MVGAAKAQAPEMSACVKGFHGNWKGRERWQILALPITTNGSEQKMTLFGSP